MSAKFLPGRRSGFVCFVLASLLLLLPRITYAQGSMPHNERGLIFATPHNDQWSQLGIFVGRPGNPSFSLMPAQAVKVAHGRFEKFMPADQTGSAYFPYNELLAYDAQEVAAGRPSLFVTATYQGQKRPVYFLPIHPVGVAPTTPFDNIPRAVNVRDERFIRFWIDHYARPIVQNSPTNTWIGLDDCRFMISMYGVLDNAGKFVAGVPWDKPFPQNDDEFLDGIKQFFKRLAELAPDIKVMCNVASLNDWKRFNEVYENVPGIMTENLLSVQENPRDHMRLKMYRQFVWYATFSGKSRATLLRATMPASNTDQMRVAVVTYLIVSGEKSYLAMQVKTSVTSTEIPPSEYADIKSALGKPEGVMQSLREPNARNDGFRLYWRTCARGIVYLNLTGQQKVITLPTGKTYYNRAGQPITEIALDDLVGDYVLDHVPEM